MITQATNGIILLIGRNFEMSIVLLPYSLKYCSHIVIYFFLNIQLSCIVCNFGDKSDHHRNPNKSHNTTAKENNAMIIHIPHRTFHFAEKYSPQPKTIASVGNNIPIGVAISNIIIIITHTDPSHDSRIDNGKALTNYHYYSRARVG
jgi:hypothetical protein